MQDEAREEIRGNIDYSASLIEALRADREVMGKMLLRLENIITTRHVGMSALQAMHEEIRGRLEDGLVDRASPRPLNEANTSPLLSRGRAHAREAAGNQRPWPADKVERWSIDRLIPYARNARTAGSANRCLDPRIWLHQPGAR
jgi:hypothetical protein